MKKFHKTLIAIMVLLGVIATGIFGYQAIGTEQGCIAVISHGAPACMSMAASDHTMFNIDAFLGFTLAVVSAASIAFVAFATAVAIKISLVHSLPLKICRVASATTRYFSHLKQKHYLHLQFHAA